MQAQVSDWAGPVNKNLGQGPVNTNWGPGPGVKQRSGGRETQRKTLIFDTTTNIYFLCNEHRLKTCIRNLELDFHCLLNVDFSNCTFLT